MIDASDLLKADKKTLGCCYYADVPRRLNLALLDECIIHLTEIWDKNNLNFKFPLLKESPRIITGYDTLSRIAFLLNKEREYFDRYGVWSPYVGFLSLYIGPTSYISKSGEISDIFVLHPLGLEYSGKVVELK